MYSYIGERDRDVCDVLALLFSFQYTAETGEFCRYFFVPLRGAPTILVLQVQQELFYLHQSIKEAHDLSWKRGKCQ
jgi:hypothetical protein